ncbi:MAG: Actin-like ATPase involved in cell division-like protein [Candidatus Berkelbacteria bacterium Licking1014_85]|uniref:Actin-like ATPase involved in cell division-like protein n=1 Tax=Candidatus Berkelbacteria bacterium Licking1014_85 TaxID=2017148 RepID=A0A554LKB4_9BACT|nr:MAG: Actin-like ATPase involved in cell division-like protein [Candidatus Berkelbacteria bacterium Licking1014_85]
MGFFDIIKGKSYDNWGISLDIGTEFVKTAIFEVKDGSAIVKGYGFQRQKLSDMQGGVVTDIAGVVKNCEHALEIAAKTAQVLPFKVVIGIAGELVKGTTTNIKYTRQNSKANLTVEELKGIVEKVQAQSFERARKILAWETGHAEIDVKLVNAAIVDVKIDGYKVTNPIGFQGKEVEIGVYNAFAPIVHLGALQTISEELDFDLLSVAAEPYAVARAVAEEEAIDFSAIILDIGGGTTDMAVVRNGGVEGTKMFGIGGRAFTKRISQLLGIPFSQAETKKIDYSQGKIHHKEELEKIKDAIKEDIKVWFLGIILTLEEFKNVDLLPSKILLCGGASQLPEI